MNKILALTAVSVFALSVASATTVCAETIDAHVKAEIVAQLKLTEEAILDFGKISTGTAGLTIVMTPAGGISGDAGRHYAGTQQAGQIKVEGLANESIAITLPNSAVTIQGPTETMDVTAFNHDAGGTPALDVSGELVFNVGATLDVNANQEVGVYNGTYTVAVIYS